MSNEAFEAAKANARDVLDGAFRAYSPLYADKVREAEGPAMCGAIEDAIANALVLVRVGLAPKPGEIAALPLVDFFGAAEALNDSVRVLGVFAAPEWDELSDDGKAWTAAFLRETLAHVPGELERLREEIAFWRADLAARLLFDTGALLAARERGNYDGAQIIELRIRSHLAAYREAEASEWHTRCDICGEAVRPGEPTLAGEDVSGHWRCLSDEAAPAVHDLSPGEDLKARVARAQEALRAMAEPAADPRPLMVPCPACADGFVTHGDRHARTAKDVCPRCGGEHVVPAATGTSAETSAPPLEIVAKPRLYVVAWDEQADAEDTVWTLSENPKKTGWDTDTGCDGYGLTKAQAEAYAAAYNLVHQVNGNGEATPGKELQETGTFLPSGENETETAIRLHIEAVAAAYGVTPAQLGAPGSFLDPEPVLYRNWRGEVRVRQLAPAYSPAETFKWHKADEWHPAGWRLRCRDAEAGHYRYYAAEGLLAWGAAAIAERQRLEAAARTLERLGYSHTPGAEEWKPPLGAVPDFEAAERRKRLAFELFEMTNGLGFDDDDLRTLKDAAEALRNIPLRAGA